MEDEISGDPATISLWPTDLFEIELVAPIKVLKSQAAYLGDASKGHVTGNVTTERRTGSDTYSYDDEVAPSDEVVHRFQLKVPALDDFVFDLFEIRHKPYALYPVRIEFHLGATYNNQNEFEASDENIFLDILKSILNDTETKTVIRTLKAQTEDADARPPDAEPQEEASQVSPLGIMEDLSTGDFGTPSEEDDIPF